MQGRFYGMSKADAAARGDELLESLDLGGLRDAQGQHAVRRPEAPPRHRPGPDPRAALLFLDEPSTGMDPQNRANLWEHIMRLREEHGTTIVLTTHYLEEADTMAERVMIIDHGRIIADDTADGAQGQAGRRPASSLTVPAPPTLARRAPSEGRELASASTPRAARALRPGASRRRGPCPACCARLGDEGVDVVAASAAAADPRRRLPQPHRPQPARRSRGMSTA